MTASTATALTPGQYALKLGVRVPQILGWINSGQLRAIDVSANPGIGRPTWRLPNSAILEFELRREARGPAAKAPRRKSKKKDSDFVTYF
jgi:hypothetical protein